MKKFLKKKLKSEKGFTLVELLAVIVILGILAAIAIPVIANLIGESREDAHNATAQQMIEAARLAQAQGSEENEFSLNELIQGEFLSAPSHPNGGKYDLDKSEVTFSTGQYTAVLYDDKGEEVGHAGSGAGSDDTNGTE